MTEQWFDKRSGNTDLCERLVPPRVCLRHLGSIPVLVTIGGALLIGQLMWGSPMLGFILLSSLLIGYNLLLALFS